MLPDIVGMSVSSSQVSSSLSWQGHNGLQAEQVLSRLDLNGDSRVDFEEFRLIWAFMNGSPRLDRVKEK